MVIKVSERKIYVIILIVFSIVSFVILANYFKTSQPLSDFLVLVITTHLIIDKLDLPKYFRDKLKNFKN